MRKLECPLNNGVKKQMWPERKNRISHQFEDHHLELRGLNVERFDSECSTNRLKVDVAYTQEKRRSYKLIW